MLASVPGPSELRLYLGNCLTGIGRRVVKMRRPNFWVGVFLVGALFCLLALLSISPPTVVIWLPVRWCFPRLTFFCVGYFMS